MPDFFSKTQIEKIVDFTLKAGEIASQAFIKKDFSIEKKADGSRVTSADIAVSQFLHKHLQNEFPKIPIVCEEGILREFSDEIFFLIDPIDGTSSFIAGNPEFCINVALIKNKKPIFGLIYAPLFEDGKMVFSNEKNQITLRRINLSNRLNDAILNRKNKSSDSFRVVTSSRSKDRDVEDYVTKNYPEFSKKFTIEKLSSAIKFFRILEGDADLYLHFRPSMEWDTAAGQAMTKMIGGELKDLTDEKILTYKKPNFENKAFKLLI
ncbi:MAG: 3'(2'),5'-bisphosphate nucleotidase CysQ [Proteobacteria bacterium]|nr:3'(2'),5'-bisphosphate nucleotidase CysQ [Pseudomonadota bacterium]